MTAEEYLIERIHTLEGENLALKLEIEELKKSKQVCFQLFDNLDHKNSRYIVTPSETGERGVNLVLKYEEAISNGTNK